MSTPAVITDPAPVSVKLEHSGDMEWRKTGRTPEPKVPVVETKAAPSTAEDVSVDAPAPESSPASEADSTQDKSKPKRNAESRIRELVAETKRLKEQLEARTQTPAESSPAPKPEPVQAEAPQKPKLEDFKTWEEYDAAKDSYYESMAKYESTQAVQRDREERSQQEQRSRVEAQLAEARKRYADFDEVAEPARKGIFEDPKVHQAIKVMANDSPVMTDLLYAIGGNADDLESFLKIAREKPTEAIRRLVIYEKLTMEALEKAQAKVTTPEKRETKAPPPPTELAGKGTTPVDEVEEARKAAESDPRKLSAWMDAENRRALKQGRK